MKLLLTILIFPLLTFSQTEYKEILARSKDATEDGVRFNLEYILYKEGSSKVEEKLIGECRALDDNYYLKIGSVTVIQNDDEKVLVNKDLAMIFITNSSPLGDYGQVNFDYLESFIDTVITLNENDKNVSYTLQFKKGTFGIPYEKIDLTISKETFLTKSIKFYYAEKVDFSEVGDSDMSRPILEINYLNGRKGGVSESTFNSSSFYEIKENGETKGVGLYSNYEIINQKL
jgi:hypothetical protein